jgi:hypothetical protein
MRALLRHGLVGLLLLAAPPQARAAGERGPVYRPEKVTREEEQGGTHWRFETWNGPVHVWRPPGYVHARAGVVAYVHGYYIDVDRAWKDHRLAEQFAASRLNALFIAPEAPDGVGLPIHWAGLGTLFVEIEKHLDLKVPRGPVVAIGHSGAYRTLVSWLDYRPLEQVILLDALYDYEEEFQAWLQERGRRAARRRLTLVVGRSTAENAKRFLTELRRLAVATAPEIPERAEQLSRRQRNARLLHLRSQFGHFELVTDGKAIPVLLGATPLRRLGR